MDLTAIYRDKTPSLATKASLAAIHLGIVLAVVWILLGGGSVIIDDTRGAGGQVGSELRRIVLAAAAVLYFLRTLATLFIFMRRRVPWSEVATIAVWIAVLDFLFAYLGGRNGAPMGAWAAVGAGLALIGSGINTGAEWQRHRWKRQPGHQGRLLAHGLWKYSRHVNYFGDVVLFTGWALLTGWPVLLAVPSLMILLFAFVNIPAQDRYLAERYPGQYEAYASRTARLIPYIY